MIVTRIFPAARAGICIRKILNSQQKIQRVNKSIFTDELKWTYRKIRKPSALDHKIAVALMGTTFWWMLWYLFIDYEEYFGLNQAPDPKLYTDEELGIPPL